MSETTVYGIKADGTTLTLNGSESASLTVTSGNAAGYSTGLKGTDFVVNDLTLTVNGGSSGEYYSSTGIKGKSISLTNSTVSGLASSSSFYGNGVCLNGTATIDVDSTIIGYGQQNGYSNVNRITLDSNPAMVYDADGTELSWDSDEYTYCYKDTGYRATYITTAAPVPSTLYVNTAWTDAEAFNNWYTAEKQEQYPGLEYGTNAFKTVKAAVDAAGGKDVNLDIIATSNSTSSTNLNPDDCLVVNDTTNNNVKSVKVESDAVLFLGANEQMNTVDISRFHGAGTIAAYGMVAIDKSAIAEDFTGSIGCVATVTAPCSFVSSIEGATSYNNLGNNGATVYAFTKKLTIGEGKTLSGEEKLVVTMNGTDFLPQTGELQDGGNLTIENGSVTGTQGKTAMEVSITKMNAYTSPSTALATLNGNMTGDITISLKDCGMVRTATFVGGTLSGDYTYDTNITAVVDNCKFYQTTNGAWSKKGYLTASMWNHGSGTLTQNGNIDYTVKNLAYAANATTTIYGLYTTGSEVSQVNGNIDMKFVDNTASGVSFYGVNNAGSTADKAILTGNLSVSLSGSTMGSFYGAVNGKIDGNYTVTVTDSTAKTYGVLSGTCASITGTSSITFNGTDTVNGKISGFNNITISSGATVNATYNLNADYSTAWTNSGTLTVDMTGAEDAQYLLVDNKTTTAMTLENYGTVNLTNGDYHTEVINNDLYAVSDNAVASVTDANNVTTYYATLKEALDVVNGTGSTDQYNGAVINVLKENYDATAEGCSSSYMPSVVRSFTLNANGANFGGTEFRCGGTGDDGSPAQEATVNLTINNAKNIYVWGSTKSSGTNGKVWNLALNSCTNTAEGMGTSWGMLYIDSNNEVLFNAELTGCSISGCNYGIVNTKGGSTTLTNCIFTDCKAPVKFSYESTETETGKSVTVTGCTFTNCGAEASFDKQAAPLVFRSKTDGAMTVTVSNVTFTGTLGANGDIIIGDGRSGKDSKPLEFTLTNTSDVTVMAEQPGYYNSGDKDLNKVQTYTKQNMTITTALETEGVLPVNADYSALSANAVVPGVGENVYLTLGSNIYNTLDSAIADVQDGNTIQITSTGDIAMATTIWNTKKFTIQGVAPVEGELQTAISTKWTGDHNSNMMGPITFKDIEIAFSFTDFYVGSAATDVLTFDNCDFTGKEGVTQAWGPGKIVLNNCDFLITGTYSDSRTEKALHVESTSGVTIEATNCYFKSKLNSNEFTGEGTPVTFTGCTFDGGDTEENGQYIAEIKLRGNVSFTNCKFTKKFADGLTAATNRDDNGFNITTNNKVYTFTNCSILDAQEEATDVSVSTLVAELGTGCAAAFYTKDGEETAVLKEVVANGMDALNTQLEAAGLTEITGMDGLTERVKYTIDGTTKTLTADSWTNGSSSYKANLSGTLTVPEGVTFSVAADATIAAGTVIRLATDQGSDAYNTFVNSLTDTQKTNATVQGWVCSVTKDEITTKYYSIAEAKAATVAGDTITLFAGDESAASVFMDGRNLTMTGGTVASVYGGVDARLSKTTDPEQSVTGDISINITGGTVTGATDGNPGKTDQWAGQGGIYGGGIASTINGDTSVAITGGSITGNVVGGGFTGRDGKNSYSMHDAVVDGNTSVTITGTAENKVTITGNVVGAGYGCNYVSATPDTSAVTGTSTVNISDAVITGFVTGGGAGKQGSNSNETVGGTITLNITDSTVNGSIYGGTNISQGNGITVMSEKITTTLNNVIVSGKVYGGNRYVTTNGTAMVQDAFLNINGGTYNGTVYGGSDDDKSQADRITVKNTHVAITDGYFDDNVYGGASNTSIAGDAELNISGGTFKYAVFGGGNGANSTVQNTSVTVSGGDFKGKLAASGKNNTVGGNAAMTITGGTFSGTLFGEYENGSTVAAVAGTTTLNLNYAEGKTITLGSTIENFDAVNVNTDITLGGAMKNIGSVTIAADKTLSADVNLNGAIVTYSDTWSNSGTFTVDMTDATDTFYKLVDNEGSQGMTEVADYGSVTLENNPDNAYQLYVFGNDLYASNVPYTTSSVVVNSALQYFDNGTVISVGDDKYIVGFNAFKDLDSAFTTCGSATIKNLTIVGRVMMEDNYVLASGGTLTVMDGATLSVSAHAVGLTETLYDFTNLAGIIGTSDGTIFLNTQSATKQAVNKWSQKKRVAGGSTTIYAATTAGSGDEEDLTYLDVITANEDSDRGPTDDKIVISRDITTEGTAYTNIMLKANEEYDQTANKNLSVAGNVTADEGCINIVNEQQKTLEVIGNITAGTVSILNGADAAAKASRPKGQEDRSGKFTVSGVVSAKKYLDESTQELVGGTLTVMTLSEDGDATRDIDFGYETHKAEDMLTIDNALGNTISGGTGTVTYEEVEVEGVITANFDAKGAVEIENAGKLSTSISTESSVTITNSGTLNGGSAKVTIEQQEVTKELAADFVAVGDVAITNSGHINANIVTGGTIKVLENSSVNTFTGTLKGKTIEFTDNTGAIKDALLIAYGTSAENKGFIEVVGNSDDSTIEDSDLYAGYSSDKSTTGTWDGAINLYGNNTIKGTTTFNGNLSNLVDSDKTTTANSLTFTAGGTASVTGDLVNAAGGTMSIAGAETEPEAVAAAELTVNGGLTNNGTITVSGTMSVTGALTNNSTITVNGDMTVTGASSNTAGASMTVNGTLTVTSLSSVEAGQVTINNGGLLAYNGTLSGDDSITVTAYTDGEAHKVIDWIGGDVADYAALVNDYESTKYYVIDNDLYYNDSTVMYVNSNYTETAGQLTADGHIAGVNAFTTFKKAQDYATSVGITLTKIISTESRPSYGEEATSTFKISTMNFNTVEFNGSEASTTYNGLIIGGNNLKNGTSRVWTDIEDDVNMTINDGLFKQTVIGGSSISGDGSVLQTGTINLTINGGTFGTTDNQGISVAGGMYFAETNLRDQAIFHGDINLTINGGTFKGMVFGGNISQNNDHYSTRTVVEGNIKLTIEAGENHAIAFKSNVIAGSRTEGLVDGNTIVTLKGDGNYLEFNGKILSGGSGADGHDYENKWNANSWVLGDRSLVFESFSNKLDAQLVMFSKVSMSDSNVTLVETETDSMLYDVKNWTMEDSSLSGYLGDNDFTGDIFDLTYDFSDGNVELVFDTENTTKEEGGYTATDQLEGWKEASSVTINTFTASRVDDNWLAVGTDGYDYTFGLASDDETKLVVTRVAH